MQLLGLGILDLGLIFNIVIILFIIVSVLLIYSLLMISIEEKTFDSGIMRLVGLSKNGYIASIMFQAFMFVLPSIILGYVGSYPALFYLSKVIEKSDTGTIVVPGFSSTLQAIFLGLFIPFLAAIIPIRVALSKSLGESLDTSRGSIKGVKITVGEGEDHTPKILLGGFCVAYGASIYYLLPYSLLTFNLTLVLGIFIGILLGMLAGLVLLIYNF